MKSKLLYLLAITFMASCSAPKYTYNFDHYTPGKKKTDVAETVATPAEVFVASVNNEPVVLVPVTEDVMALPATETQPGQAKEASVFTKKEVKKEVKQYIKSVKKTNSIESVTATKAMDNDLKLAAIFGAVGLVALIIGGQVFWIIGGIAMIIGVVFFVKWLLRQ